MRKLLLPAVLLALMIGGGLISQVYQPGGITVVTANSGTNLNTSLLALESGGNLALIKAKTDNVDVALSTRLKPADTLTAVTTVGAVTSITNAVSVVPKTACGTTVASQPLAAVPTSSTAVFASTTCVVAIELTNTSGGSLTVTVSDNQGTPINSLLTFTLPSLSQIIQPLWGIQFTSGLKWVASGSGVTGGIIGYQ